MAKKTFNEKLHYAGDLPKVEAVTDPRAVSRFGGVDMAIAPPMDYDEMMRKIPEGKLITSTEIRQAIAKKYHADYTCQMTCRHFYQYCSKCLKRKRIARK